MYKLYKITDAEKRAAFVLVAQGSRGKLGPLINQLSRNRNPHALYDINGALVARSW